MGVKGGKAGRSTRTRQRLLRSAEKLFGRRGFEATFLDDVASGARVTKGAIYHQFRDKRELFEAVFRERVESIVDTTRRRSREWVDERGAGRRSLARAQAALEVLLDELSEPTNRRILLVDGPAALGRERWNALWGEVMLSFVRGLPRYALERGRLEPALVAPATHLFSGALQEAALAIGHAEDPEEARQAFGAAARWLLDRVLSDEPEARSRRA
jgi:AcrR family transcriptional regulator